MSRFTYTAEDVLRAAAALWESHNPDTELWQVEESERQEAWAKAAADAEIVLKAGGRGRRPNVAALGAALVARAVEPDPVGSWGRRQLRHFTADAEVRASRWPMPLAGSATGAEVVRTGA